ncbi:MAG: biotin carboxyl carrier protein, partial [Sphingomonas bacterium]
MSLTAKDIEAIMRLLDASRFDRLKLEMDGLKLELARGPAAGKPAADPAAPAAPPAPAARPAPEPAP